MLCCFPFPLPCFGISLPLDLVAFGRRAEVWSLRGMRAELRPTGHILWRFAARPGLSLAPVAAHRLPEPINQGE